MLEPKQIEQEWRRLYPKVYGYFYKRVNSQTDVEDLTAQSLTTLFLAENVINVNAYLWKVCHNYLVRYINTKSKEPMTVAILEEQDFDQSTPGFRIEAGIETTYSPHFLEKKANLKQCVENQLQENEKEMVMLCIYEDKNSTEVGQILNIQPAAVRKRLSRILQKLRTHCKQLWIS